MGWADQEWGGGAATQHGRQLEPPTLVREQITDNYQHVFSCHT